MAPSPAIALSSAFRSSPLIRQFAPWAPWAPVACDADVAERLAAWVGPLDAIRLQSLHQAVADTAAEPAARRHPRPQAVDGDVQRVRAVLANAIAKDPLLLAGVRPGDGEDPGFGPWQQRHVELQRQMAQMVDALRDHVRQAAGRASPRLRALAAVDAAFQELLAPREQAAFPATLALLERRYRELRAHAQATETPTDPPGPDAWRATFAEDFRQALLAELDARLEPVRGLAEALQAESATPPS